MEMKFRTTLPDLFKGLIEHLGLQAQAMSKYRFSVQTFGWDATVQPGVIIAVNGQAHPAVNDPPKPLWIETAPRPTMPD